MAHRKSTCVLASTALICLLHQAQAVVMEDCKAMLWRGSPAPRSALYAPPVGESRLTVALDARWEGPTTWVRSAALNLSEAHQIAVRLHSSAAGKANLALASGPGAYTRDFGIDRGEQIVLLTLGSFSRADGAGGWDEVRELKLTLVARETPCTVQLLRMEALTEAAPVAPNELILLHPASRVHRQGMAYPMYALMDLGLYCTGRTAFTLTLKKYLNRVAGRSVPHNPKGVEITPDLTNVILLGKEAALTAGTLSPNELDPWGSQGFVIKARSPIITIAGNTRHGVGYGIYRFLEQQGCRFYAYGCEIVPERKDGVLLDCELADRPFMHVKGCTGAYAIRGWQGSLMGDPRGTDDPPLTDKTQWIDHTAAYLVPKSVYYDKRPEYYALLANGKRMSKDLPDVRVMICLTHPDVLRISAERTLRWIEMQRDRRVFVIAQGDGVEWCHCDGCQQVGNRSDQTLYWVNHVAREVAKKYPDKVLMCHAYNGSEAPPLRLKPAKNVIIMYAAWPNASNAPNSLRDFDARENVVAGTHLRGWLKVAPGQMGVYDYNAGGRLTLYGMGHRIKWMAKNDLRGVWYCGTPWFFRDLFIFVHCRLTWDPYEDITSLRNEFIRAYYGEAAPLVRELCDLIYFRLEHGDYDARMRAGGFPPPDYFERKFVDNAFELFDRALELTKGNNRAHTDLQKTKELYIANCFGLRPGLSGELSDDEYYVFGRNLTEYVNNVWLPQLTSPRSKKEPRFSDLKSKIWALTFVDIGEPPAEGKLPPLLLEMMRNPKKVIDERRKTYFVETAPDGWRMPGIQFRGGQYWRSYSWQCPRREHCMVVRGRMTDVSTMEARLILDAPPPDRDGLLEVEGQDSDKMWAEPAPIEIRINKSLLYDGPNNFAKMGWSRRTWRLPKGTLHQGENVIRIRNNAASDSLTSHWFMLSECRVRFPREPVE